MKIFLTVLFVVLAGYTSQAQTCTELLKYVKSKDYGFTYSSYDSDAISSVSFHTVTDENYKTYYFAVVRFTSSLNEYIYQVDSNTKFNYSLDYLDSAGQAFWDHIHPYRNVLGCSPSFD